MGATYRSATSIALVVLLAGTALAPMVGASDDVQETIDAAASGAQRSAQEAQAEAEREAAAAREDAEARAKAADRKLQGQSENAQDLANTVLQTGLAAASELREAAEEFIG